MKTPTSVTGGFRRLRLLSRLLTPLVLVLVFVFLLASLPAFAETGLQGFLQDAEIPITLGDVVNLMLDRNLDIAANRLSPVLSRLQSLSLYRFLQPSLSIGGSVNRDTSASTTQLNGAQSLSQLRHAFSAGYSQTLPSGTSFSAIGTMNRTSSNSFLNTYNPSYSGNITYSVTQHFLQGRTRIVNMRQILQSQNNEKISEAQFEIQLINQIVTAQKTYWDLVFSNEDLKVKRRSLELAERTLEENKARVEIGTMAPIDVKQTESDVVARKEQVIITSGSVTLSEDQIKRLIAGEADISMFFVRLKTLEISPSGDRAYAAAPDGSGEDRHGEPARTPQAELDERNRDLDVKVARNNKLPVLDGSLTFRQYGTGGTQTVRPAFGDTSVTSTIPGGLSDALSQLFGYKYKGYGAAFNLTIPLKNEAAEAEFSRAVNERKLADARLNVTKATIMGEVRQAVIQSDNNRARIDTAQTARELAEIKLEAEKTRFDLGVSTLRFVLEEQRNLAQAQSSELQAIVNYTKSLVDLDRAMGVTLKKNNVEIDKALAPSPAGPRQAAR